MKTLAQWAYPAAVLALWIVLAAYTLSGLSTVEPSLRSAASRPRPPVQFVPATVPWACNRRPARPGANAPCGCEVAVHDALQATDRPGRSAARARALVSLSE